MHDGRGARQPSDLGPPIRHLTIISGGPRCTTFSARNVSKGDVRDRMRVGPRLYRASLYISTPIQMAFQYRLPADDLHAPNPTVAGPFQFSTHRSLTSREWVVLLPYVGRMLSAGVVQRPPPVYHLLPKEVRGIPKPPSRLPPSCHATSPPCFPALSHVPPPCPIWYVSTSPTTSSVYTMTSSVHTTTSSIRNAMSPTMSSIRTSGPLMTSC